MEKRLKGAEVRMESAMQAGFKAACEELLTRTTNFVNQAMNHDKSQREGTMRNMLLVHAQDQRNALKTREHEERLNQMIADSKADLLGRL